MVKKSQQQREKSLEKEEIEQPTTEAPEIDERQLEERNKGAGEKWNEQLNSAINQSTITLLIVDKTSINSTITELEIDISDMGKVEEGREQPRQKLTQAQKIERVELLSRELEEAKAYDKLDPRRRAMLRTYLTDQETSILELGKLPEVGLRSKSRLIDLLHSGMEVAFYQLSQEVQEDFISPLEALRLRASLMTEDKSKKLQQARDRRKNQETGKIEFAAGKRDNISNAQSERWRRYRAGDYTGKPIGRPRTKRTT